MTGPDRRTFLGVFASAGLSSELVILLRDRATPPTGARAVIV